MLKIEFPADRTDIAHALGRALLSIGVAASHEPTDKLMTTGDIVALAEQVGRTVELEEPAQVPSADAFGVPFDPNYCAQAKEPFYTSGPQKGQWKKRKGVSEEDYAAWYAERRAPQTQTVQVAATVEDEPQVNPTEAFKPQATAAPTPKTTGELMKWISELMQAKRVTQDDVNAAYREAGVNDITALFPPNPPAQIETSVSAIHAALNSKVGAV